MSRVAVVNVRGLRTPEQRATVVYCGRAFAGWPESPWHNPFRPGDTSDEERAKCIEMYRGLVSRMKYVSLMLGTLWHACNHGAKPLGCWCAPKACHCDVLADMLNERFADKRSDD